MRGCSGWRGHLLPFLLSCPIFCFVVKLACILCLFGFCICPSVSLSFFFLHLIPMCGMSAYMFSVGAIALSLNSIDYQFHPSRLSILPFLSFFFSFLPGLGLQLCVHVCWYAFSLANRVLSALPPLLPSLSFFLFSSQLCRLTLFHDHHHLVVVLFDSFFPSAYSYVYLSADMFSVGQIALAQPSLWIGLIIIVCICLLPDLFITA